MGTSVNAQDDVDSEYVKCVDILLGILIDRAFSPFLQNEFLYRFSNTYRIEQQALKVVHGYSRSVINKRMAEFSKSQKEEESFGDTMGIKKKKAFLDLLLEYSSKDPSFTFDDICQEVDTFMFEVAANFKLLLRVIWFENSFNFYILGPRYNSYFHIFCTVFFSAKSGYSGRY